MFHFHTPLVSRNEENTAAPEEPVLTEEESETMDFLIGVGQMCWKSFVASPRGMMLTMLLPSDRVRREANHLFQLGFGARLFLFPPFGPDALDAVIGSALCEKAWKVQLARSGGKTILDGKPYPETQEAILSVAKHFFKMGFEAGTVAAREIMKG